MVSSSRGFLGKFVVMLLMGLLIASFAIWGIGDIFRTPSSNVATVGEAEISDVEFQQTFQNRLRMYQQQFGAEFTQQQAVSLGLHQNILQELIQKTAIDEEARILGVRGTDKMVQEEIQKIEAFKDFSGNFSFQNYQFALAQAGYNPQSFENMLRTDMGRQQLLDAVSANTIVPDALVKELYAYRKESRTADILSIPASTITDIATPEEETLIDYHKNNSQRFMTPEYREFSYIVLNAGDYAKDVEISEDDIKAEYDARMDEFVTPDSRSVDMVSFVDEKAARDFYARVEAGEDFLTLGAELTGFAADELTLGDVTEQSLRSDYSQTISDAVFNVDLNGMTQPQQTLLGWYVFRVTNIQEGNSRSLEDVREELVASIKANKGSDKLYDIIGRIDDEIAGGSDLDVLAEALQLQLTHVAAVNRSGLDTEGNLVQTDGLNTVLAQAFQNTPETDLQAYEQGTDTFYLVHVNQIVAPVLRPYEDVKDQVTAGWRADEQVKQAGVIADEALQAANNGAALQELALKYGGNIINTPTLIRDQLRSQRDVASNIADLIFSLKLDGIDMERSATGDGYVLVKVTSIAAGQVEGNEDAVKALKEQLATEVSNDLMGEFSYAVQMAVPINPNMRRVIELVDPTAAIQ